MQRSSVLTRLLLQDVGEGVGLNSCGRAALSRRPGAGGTRTCAALTGVRVDPRGQGQLNLTVLAVAQLYVHRKIVLYLLTVAGARWCRGRGSRRGLGETRLRLVKAVHLLHLILAAIRLLSTAV